MFGGGVRNLPRPLSPDARGEGGRRGLERPRGVPGSFLADLVRGT